MSAFSSNSWIALFPGQGSQFTGMGKSLSENFTVARDVYEEASDAIKFNLSKLCFEGATTDLALTENTQPAILVTSIAALRVAERELGFKPSLVAGHSLGEYSALVAAGALSLAQATQWVRARGRAMQEAVPVGDGKMAALLGMDDQAVTELCSLARAEAQSMRNKGERPDLRVAATVEPANFNSEGQTVIAGSADGVDQAVALIKTRTEWSRVKAMPLNVSAPFHCSLMEPAREKMIEIFSHSPAQPIQLNCPYVPNLTARPTQEPSVILEFLADQITHPVLWKQSVQAMLAAGLTHAVEFGPRNVLQGLAKRIKSPEGATLSILTLGESSELSALGSTYKP